jgi:hypothetical protein
VLFSRQCFQTVYMGTTEEFSCRHATSSAESWSGWTTTRRYINRNAMRFRLSAESGMHGSYSSLSGDLFGMRTLVVILSLLYGSP